MFWRPDLLIYLIFMQTYSVLFIGFTSENCKNTIIQKITGEFWGNKKLDKISAPYPISGIHFVYELRGSQEMCGAYFYIPHRKWHKLNKE